MPRPAKSPELHALAGTQPQTVSVPVSAVPEGRPAFGKITPEEKQTFKRIVGMLRERRHCTRADREIIAIYAAAEQQWLRAKAHIAAQGEVCQYERLDSNGQAHTFWKENLWCKIFREAQSTMISCLDRLGLTPRAKDMVKPAVQPKSDKPLDPIEEIINGGPGKVLPFAVPDLTDLETEP